MHDSILYRATLYFIDVCVVKLNTVSFPAPFIIFGITFLHIRSSKTCHIQFVFDGKSLTVFHICQFATDGRMIDFCLEREV